ncbi:hypothetical protein [Rheinheimera texasensis]|uniref:hypothetical protein n=1 Tax=Rheinheimera texasensis TaxID=306205 RepID=UPI0032B20C34
MTIIKFIFFWCAIIGYAKANEGSCLFDIPISENTAGIKLISNGDIFKQVDDKKIFDYLVKHYKRKEHYAGSIHNADIQSYITFSDSDLHVEQVVSEKYNKVNTLCATVKSSNKLIELFIDSSVAFDFFKKKCISSCEVKISSYDENLIMYILFSGEKLLAIKYINLGYDG